MTDQIIAEFREGLKELIGWVHGRPISTEKKTKRWLQKANLMLESRAFVPLAKSSMRDVDRATPHVGGVGRKTMFGIAEAAGMPEVPDALRQHILGAADDDMRIVEQQCTYLLELCRKYVEVAQ